MRLDGLSLLMGTATVLFLGVSVAFLWLSRYSSEVGAARQYEALRKPAKTSKKQVLHQLIQRLYLLCSRLPLLRAYLSPIRKRLTILHMGEEWKLRLETMRVTLWAWSVLGLASLPLLLWVRDPMNLLMLLIGCWVVHGMMADVAVQRLEVRLLRQLHTFLGDLRHHYHRHGMVEEALYEVADSAAYEMALHGQELVEVLSASHTEERLEQYLETAPNRYLKGLAGLSHLTKEYGDKQTEEGSLYLQSLGKLTNELNLELLRRERLGFLLQGLSVIALLPLLFTQPLEAWGSRYFPAMAAFYTSTSGWITKLGVLLVVWLSYMLLRHIQELEVTPKTTDRAIWEKHLYQWGWVRRLVHRLGPSPGSDEATRLIRLLKESGSPLRLEWFTLRRIMAGIIALLMAIGIGAALHITERHQLLYTPVRSGILLGQPTPEEQASAEAALALDRQMMEQLKGVKQRSIGTILSLLGGEADKGKTEAQLEADARRILGKLEQLDQQYVKWWEVLLILLTGWAGYCLPVGIRLFQRKMRQMEMKHEVDQLHTVIAMLAHMERMSVEDLLIWLEQFARLFKEPLQFCLLHFDQGAEQALVQLKEDVPFLPFVRTVEKLELAAQSLPLREVFDDLESEYTFAQEQRKQEYEQLIEHKAGWGRWIGFAPMMTLIFGYLVLPLIWVSLNQMSVYYEQLQRIQ
ncbi:hypothetical protein PPYC1_20100 [Paenibacillus polymyxa]|uniref:hypothetical protein n=1 Tax=Paenibacillus polymyxa TaxID=1406 RepID=UPI0009BF6EF7|nr:hypothetical protein [Paenibacillus polymyxa]APB72534.2 hypothetical protein PPYC1_20100 [Paenibacillus polymyxa]